MTNTTATAKTAPQGRHCVVCGKQYGCFAYAVEGADGESWSVNAHLKCIRRLQQMPVALRRFVRDEATTGGEHRRVAKGIKRGSER